MGPVVGDLPDTARDVLQAGGDGAPSGIHQVRRNVGCVEEGMNLRLQV